MFFFIVLNKYLSFLMIMYKGDSIQEEYDVIHFETG